MAAGDLVAAAKLDEANRHFGGSVERNRTEVVFHHAKRIGPARLPSHKVEGHAGGVAVRVG
jgi:hypothetical protein